MTDEVVAITARRQTRTNETGRWPCCIRPLPDRSLNSAATALRSVIRDR
jgi:hypothetical protein